MKIDNTLFEAIDYVELRTGLPVLEMVRKLPEPPKGKIYKRAEETLQ